MARTGTLSLGMVSAVPRGLVVLRDVTFGALTSIFRLPLLFFRVGHEFYGPSVNIDFFARQEPLSVFHRPKVHKSIRLELVLGVFDLVDTLDLPVLGENLGQIFYWVFYWQILQVDPLQAIFGSFALVGVGQLEKKRSLVKGQRLRRLQELVQVLVVHLEEGEAAGQACFVVPCQPDVLYPGVVLEHLLDRLLVCFRAEPPHE